MGNCLAKLLNRMKKPTQIHPQTKQHVGVDFVFEDSQRAAGESMLQNELASAQNLSLLALSKHEREEIKVDQKDEDSCKLSSKTLAVNKLPLINLKSEVQIDDESGLTTKGKQPRAKDMEKFNYDFEKLTNALVLQNQDQYYQAEDSQEFYEPLQPRELPTKFNWERSQLIGQGSFGKVYFGMNLDNGQQMAVKQVEINGVKPDDPRIKALETEMQLLSKLQDRNIVQYYGMERTANNINIFLEFVGGGSLAQIIKQFGALKESLIISYTREMLNGLAYLHRNGVMHRDIKGANVLVDKMGVCKLADFGSSKQFHGLIQQEMFASLSGTPNWMAPEVMEQEQYGRFKNILTDRKADIWSVGCTIIELATGKPPWGAFANPFTALYHISTKKGGPPIPEHLSPQAKDFLSKCLQQKPQDRWTASHLLNHPWLTQSPRKQSKSTLGKLKKKKSKKQLFSYNEDIRLRSQTTQYDNSDTDNARTFTKSKIKTRETQVEQEPSVEYNQNRLKSLSQQVLLVVQKSPTQEYTPNVHSARERVAEDQVEEVKNDSNQNIFEFSKYPPQILESSQESSFRLSLKVPDLEASIQIVKSWMKDDNTQKKMTGAALDFDGIQQQHSSAESDR